MINWLFAGVSQQSNFYSKIIPPYSVFIPSMNSLRYSVLAFCLLFLSAGTSNLLGSDQISLDSFSQEKAFPYLSGSERARWYMAVDRIERAGQKARDGKWWKSRADNASDSSLGMSSDHYRKKGDKMIKEAKQQRKMALKQIQELSRIAQKRKKQQDEQTEKEPRKYELELKPTDWDAFLQNQPEVWLQSITENVSKESTIYFLGAIRMRSQKFPVFIEEATYEIEKQLRKVTEKHNHLQLKQTRKASLLPMTWDNGRWRSLEADDPDKRSYIMVLENLYVEELGVFCMQMLLIDLEETRVENLHTYIFPFHNSLFEPFELGDTWKNREPPSSKFKKVKFELIQQIDLIERLKNAPKITPSRVAYNEWSLKTPPSERNLEGYLTMMAMRAVLFQETSFALHEMNLVLRNLSELKLEKSLKMPGNLVWKLSPSEEPLSFEISAYSKIYDKSLLGGKLKISTIDAE